MDLNQPVKYSTLHVDSFFNGDENVASFVLRKEMRDVIGVRVNKCEIPQSYANVIDARNPVSNNLEQTAFSIDVGAFVGNATVFLGASADVLIPPNAYTAATLASNLQRLLSGPDVSLANFSDTGLVGITVPWEVEIAPLTFAKARFPNCTVTFQVADALYAYDRFLINLGDTVWTAGPFANPGTAYNPLSWQGGVAPTVSVQSTNRMIQNALGIPTQVAEYVLTLPTPTTSNIFTYRSPANVFLAFPSYLRLHTNFATGLNTYTNNDKEDDTLLANIPVNAPISTVVYWENPLEDFHKFDNPQLFREIRCWFSHPYGNCDEPIDFKHLPFAVELGVYSLNRSDTFYSQDRVSSR